jgi:hypothetical protein
MEKKEYIERGALDTELQNLVREYNRNCESDKSSGAFEALYRLRLFPAADVVEVVHGEWEIVSESYRLFDDYDEAYFVKCPFCDRTYYVPFEFEEEKMIAYAREHYPYCHCGAKMDGGKHETD